MFSVEKVSQLAQIARCSGELSSFTKIFSSSQQQDCIGKAMQAALGAGQLPQLAPAAPLGELFEADLVWRCRGPLYLRAAALAVGSEGHQAPPRVPAVFRFGCSTCACLGEQGGGRPLLRCNSELTLCPSSPFDEILGLCVFAVPVAAAADTRLWHGGRPRVPGGALAGQQCS